MSDLSRRRFLKGTVGGGLAALGVPVLTRLAYAGETARAADIPEESVGFFGIGFDPMVAHIATGSGLTFSNRGGSSLELRAAPGAPQAVSKRVAAGGDTSVQFDEPGLYLLYDDATTRFDDRVKQVVARKKADTFPRPAYAIVLVTDESGGGLNPDKPLVTIPESTMTFRPWSLAVKAGTPIKFDNQDGDMHVAMPSSEPMLMPSLASNGSTSSGGGEQGWLRKMNAFAPITLPGNGGRGEITLSQPGVHHYFCPVHAAYDAAARTFAPLKSYGGYPYIMDGVIVVLPA